MGGYYRLPVYGCDPGHGGKNTGAKAIDRHGCKILEKDLTISIATEVRAALPHVVLTRENDDDIEEFYERSRRMRRALVDVVVSLHCDSTPWSKTTHGTHAYYRRNDSVGRELARYAVSNTPIELAPSRSAVICAHDNPDTRRDDWKLRAQQIVQCYAPSHVVLIECGYMSHASDLAFLSSSTGIRACAELVVATYDYYNHLTRGRG